MLRTVLCASGLVGLLLAPAPAPASWAQVPLEILVDKADLIVVGKVTRIDQAGFVKALGNFQRRYDAAIVQVDAVLKGKEKPKEVRIGQPALGGGVAVSTDIRFGVGQDGVWLLTWDAKHNVYWALHPSQFQPAGERAKVEKLVAQREKLQGGTPVKGLVARAEVETKGGLYEVRLSLKNVSKNPIAICTHVGQRPVGAKWVGPDGKERESMHYDWLKAVRLRPPTAEDFVTIPPGGVHHIGPRGATDGVRFSAGAVDDDNVNRAAPGRHTVTLSYINNNDAKGLNVANVWTGTVTANPVTFTVK